jgi:hypothetical protein
VLAGVTSLPNAVAAIYLALRGRGAATLSEAFNSNAINAIVGLMLPGAILGLTRPPGDALFVALSLVILTGACVGLALRGRGLDRRAGSPGPPEQSGEPAEPSPVGPVTVRQRHVDPRPARRDRRAKRQPA